MCIRDSKKKGIQYRRSILSDAIVPNVLLSAAPVEKTTCLAPHSAIVAVAGLPMVVLTAKTYLVGPNIKLVGSCKINKTHLFLPIAMRFVHL